MLHIFKNLKLKKYFDRNSVSDTVNFLFWNPQNTKYIFLISLLCKVVLSLFSSCITLDQRLALPPHLQTTTYSVFNKSRYYKEILYFFLLSQITKSKENFKVYIHLKVSLNVTPDVTHVYIIEKRFNKFFTVISVCS